MALGWFMTSLRMVQQKHDALAARDLMYADQNKIHINNPLLFSFMPENNRIRLAFIGNPSFEQLLKLYTALGRMCYEKNGFSVQILDITPAYITGDGVKVQLQRSPFSPYVNRSEVYNAMQQYIRPEKLDALKEELNTRFPEKTWNDTFPTLGILRVLVTENLESLL